MSPEYGERAFGAVHALYWLTVNLADADSEFCRACHHATGCNPLFLRELVGAAAGQNTTECRATADLPT